MKSSRSSGTGKLQNVTENDVKWSFRLTNWRQDKVCCRSRCGLRFHHRWVSLRSVDVTASLGRWVILRRGRKWGFPFLEIRDSHIHCDWRGPRQSRCMKDMTYSGGSVCGVSLHAYVDYFKNYGRGGGEMGGFKTSVKFNYKKMEGELLHTSMKSHNLSNVMFSQPWIASVISTNCVWNGDGDIEVIDRSKMSAWRRFSGPPSGTRICGLRHHLFIQFLLPLPAVTIHTIRHTPRCVCDTVKSIFHHLSWIHSSFKSLKFSIAIGSRLGTPEMQSRVPSQYSQVRTVDCISLTQNLSKCDTRNFPVYFLTPWEEWVGYCVGPQQAIEVFS